MMTWPDSAQRDGITDFLGERGGGHVTRETTYLFRDSSRQTSPARNSTEFILFQFAEKDSQIDFTPADLDRIKRNTAPLP